MFDFRLLRWLKPPEQTAIGIAPPDGSFDAPPCNDWQCMDSDMAARMYRNDTQLLHNFGVCSSVIGIKEAISRFRSKGTRAIRKRDRRVGSAAAFILQPTQQEIYNVMALSIQGHFEKAFRRWLRNSLLFSEQTVITDEDIVKAQWSNPNAPRKDLGAIMAALRGVHLHDVVEGPLLIELALIGNVVRHGDGPSARQAYDRFPFLFDAVPVSDEEPVHSEYEELPERLRVSEERLALYAQAVFQFWHRIQFAYTEEY